MKANMIPNKPLKKWMRIGCRNFEFSCELWSHTYIVIKSIFVKVVGFSSNWHAFDGISNTDPSDSMRNTLLTMNSKCLIEQSAGKQIPSEILGPMSSLWGIDQRFKVFGFRLHSHSKHILSKIKMWNRFFGRKFQLANAVLCAIIASIAFDVQTLWKCSQIKEVPT